jgi:acetylserotonin N-methyltransferase
MQDLNMLVCTDGRERTASEYEILLRNAGFAQVLAVRTGTPLDAILGLKGA